MLVVTSDTIPGKKITQVIGLVFGIKAPDQGKGVRECMKETKEQGKLSISEIHDSAIEHMIIQAKVKNANAIVTCRMNTVTMKDILFSFHCYGTAVIIEDE